MTLSKSALFALPFLFGTLLGEPASAAAAGVQQPLSFPQSTSAVAQTGNTIAQDTFDRTVAGAWGAAPTGGAYTFVGGATETAVANGVGTFTLRTPASGSTALLPQASQRDVDMQVKVQSNKTSTGSGQFAYLVARHGANGEYRAQLQFAPNGSVHVRATVASNGEERLLGEPVQVPNVTAAPTTPVWLRTQVVGANPTTIRMKAWAATQSEPSVWHATITDATPTVQPAGAVGVRAYVPSSATNTPVQIGFDDFKVSLPLIAVPAPAPADPVPAGVTIKNTNYPIPAGALFVSPGGNDNNAGTQAAPWRTVRKALAAAPNGATVVLRGGTYREGGLQLGGKRLTLQPYPHEQVWVKGSVVVTGWVQEGSVWRKDGWTYQFKRGLPQDYIDPAYPLAAYPDMMFINGQPLKQVATKGEVKPGTFFVDYATKQLYIGDNPQGKTVEGAAHAQGLRITNATGSVVRGIGFAHYATHRDDYGAVQNDADRVLVEDATFAYNAASGLSILASDVVVRGNTFMYNGQLGVQGFTAHQLLLERNYLAFNNQERFLWEAGGAKVTHSNNMVWRDNVVEHNARQGLWLDESCYNTTIVRNVVRNNSHSGIMYEVSAKAIIASNLIINNGQYGVYVSEAEDVDVYNNTLVGNNVNLRVFEGRRTSTRTPLITFDVRDIVVRNNIMANGMASSENGLFSVYDIQRQKTAEQMGVNTDYNVYYRTNARVPSAVVQWAAGAKGGVFYPTLDAFRDATGQERHGFAIDNAPNPFFVDEAKGNYQLRADSVARNKGQPLPDPIASAIGVPANVPVDLGVLVWR